MAYIRQAGPSTKCRMCGHPRRRHPLSDRKDPNKGGCCNVRGCWCAEYRWWRGDAMGRLDVEAPDDAKEALVGDVPVYCLDCRFRERVDRCGRIPEVASCTERVVNCQAAGWREYRVPATLPARRHSGSTGGWADALSDDNNPSLQPRKAWED